MPSGDFRPVSHVIFDMDGLLLDTETRYEKAISTVTGMFGKEYPFEVRMKVMGRTGYDCAKVICSELNLPISVDEYLDLINVEYQKVFDGVSMMPGAERLVRHLAAKGIPIAIATSSKKATFEIKTQHLQDVFGLFHHILIASDDPEITRGKPDPQTFLVCAGRFDDPPKDMASVLVFEDSPMGVQAALAAGMQCVWVPDPNLDKAVARPTVTLNSLLEFDPKLFHLPDY